ncbi:MAG TPA: ATP-binding protein [Gemmatimonadales bacterium]
MRLAQRLLLGVLLALSVTLVAIVVLFRLEPRDGVTGGHLVVGGAAVLLTGIMLARLFQRTVGHPVVELRDVARSLAAGDLSRRPALTAPAELGDLASALHRMAEQLAARVEALRAEEALLGALTEALNEGVVAVDSRQQIVRINATGRRLLNVRTTVPFPVDHLPRERALRDALAAALDGDATDAAEAVVSGHTIILAARPLPEGGAVLALYDLTQIRRLEAVRRDFVANVSHELRTPLTVVGGFAEALTEEELPAAQRRKFADTIRTNALRMQRIVDDLLDLSRIESGGWVPKPEPLPVRAVAEEVVAACAAAAAARDVTVGVEVAPGAETIFADPTALRQVLGNLVDNAVRHTSAGSVSVTAGPLPGGGVEIGVVDTGTGIPAEHLPRIFERFYRADPARSRAGGGTGLGLSIVRHLVEAHGGRVGAESSPGRGTTIRVTFPARR